MRTLFSLLLKNQILALCWGIYEKNKFSKELKNMACWALKPFGQLETVNKNSCESNVKKIINEKEQRNLS